jgi:hypothetical protein
MTARVRTIKSSPVAKKALVHRASKAANAIKKSAKKVARKSKYTPEPVKFSIPPSRFRRFGQRLRLSYRVKSFDGTIRKMQSFGL